uniref:Uncharacterized protein n=1 Tax=Romanomermis culicivorax TaxID=13658 RepID=A0A915KK80_ROMCU
MMTASHNLIARSQHHYDISPGSISDDEDDPFERWMTKLDVPPPSAYTFPQWLHCPRSLPTFFTCCQTKDDDDDEEDDDINSTHEIQIS